jgi:hypothetical protein
MKKYSWYTNTVKVTDYLTVYQYAVDREIFLEKRKDGSTSFILVKKGTYVTRHDGGWQRYKPNMKGGHTHNHLKNMELRLMLTKKEIKALRKIMKREKKNGRN